ncbi:unnamed protein product [Schistocephalus solidus]|uniref:Uncharacterized protein n=1 Tax=Schistocephalus solidus TaxID=70667 RepID=A0A183STV0_SCHSO|nr:unnamed protein product [Schistocephalus solidus]
MFLWPPLASTQISPVAPRSLFFPAATPQATTTTSGLNQVRVSGVVCASTPVRLLPFPALANLPASTHPPALSSFPPSSPLLTFPPFPLLSSPFLSPPSSLYPMVKKVLRQGRQQSLSSPGESSFSQ